MHRGGKRPENSDESVTDRLARLDAALTDVRKQTAKMVDDTLRAMEKRQQSRRRDTVVKPKRQKRR